MKREKELELLNHESYLIVAKKIEKEIYKPYNLRDEKNIFKLDLFEAFNVTQHPKAEKLFYLAWEYGHSNGLHEVLVHFEEMVPLIQE